MLSVRYIFLLYIYIIKLARCVSLKNMNPQKEALRILGARDALPGEYPYVLSIEVEVTIRGLPVNFNLCTCACIKPTWSLTAAHCILDMDSLTDMGVNKFVLRYKPSHTEVAFVKILSTFITPNYYSTSQPFFIHNDIGILKSEIINLSNYARISSVDYATLYGNKISAVGYGLMIDNQGSFNDTLSLNKTLQVVDAMIRKCDFKKATIYCLAGICEKWTPLAPGDSGGPVLHSSGIVGVNTASNFEYYRKMGFIPGYEIKSYIGVITPVSPFMDWIVTVIK